MNGDDEAFETEDSPHDETSTKRRSGRHGARNQHRHKHFCKWIIETFDLKEGDLILDVAGGKGELAARLCICHRLKVMLVDPRPADVVRTFETLVLPKLPNRHQQRLNEHLNENPNFLRHVFQERFRQLEIMFTDDTTNPELQRALQSASLIVGLHADGATEYVIDAALLYNKPFVVVPCCVFPNLFSQRCLASGETVRTHDQFCQYLLEKDERFQKACLTFEGRNIAIFWR